MIVVPFEEFRFAMGNKPKFTVFPVGVKPDPVMVTAVNTGPEEGVRELIVGAEVVSGAAFEHWKYQASVFEGGALPMVTHSVVCLTGVEGSRQTNCAAVHVPVTKQWPEVLQTLFALSTGMV